MIVSSEIVILFFNNCLSIFQCNIYLTYDNLIYYFSIDLD